MSISLLPEHIHGLAPQCLLPYRAAFERARTALEPAGIDTPLRLAHFMAPVTHETGGLTLKRLIKPTARTEFALSDAHRTLVRLRFSPATSAARNRFPRCPWLCEDLDYSAARLPVVLSLRLLPRGQLVPGDYAHNPRKLANAVNGGRLGNVDPDDGYRFRGRGILQLTGKDSYARVTTSLHRQGAAPPDFAREPDAILMPAWGLRVACGRRSLAGRRLQYSGRCRRYRHSDPLDYRWIGWHARTHRLVPAHARAVVVNLVTDRLSDERRRAFLFSVRQRTVALIVRT